MMKRATFSDAAITARVCDILADNLGVDIEDVTPDSTLREDLGADSLDVVEIALALEEEFNIEINDAIADRMVSVTDVIQHVRQVTHRP